MNPKYPIYIVSKGRWESRLTAKALDNMKVPYKVVIEPQELQQYSSVFNPKDILVLPFSNLGLGSIPARNWIWDHAVASGAKRHWILDDNIKKFGRLNNNKRLYVADGSIFRAAEDFIDRYTNVAIAGFQYQGFVEERTVKKPFILNTRVYSCILIKNDIPYRWRGIYNEDTDLSIRVLKDGWCTILFYAFFADKATTLTMAGGNMEKLYREDGRLRMAISLQKQHPDIVKIYWRWNRWQHLVDYSGFRKNKLKLREGIDILQGVNNYGMKLVKKIKRI